MIASGVEFPYLQTEPDGSVQGLRPMLPVTLARGDKAVSRLALVDSGGDLNVLPFQVGLDLGLVWDSLPHELVLGGAMGGTPAKFAGVRLTADPFPTVDMLFAWSSRSNVKLILGQLNFLLTFDVCFFRSRCAFKVNLAR